MLEQAFLTLVAVVLTVISLSLAAAAWTRSRRTYRRAFALLMIAEAVMAWSYLLDVVAPTLSEKLLWNNFEYVGYLTAVPLFFTFAVQFAVDIKLDRRLLAAIFLPAPVFLLALLTNDHHHLFYVSTQLTDEVFRSFNAVYGPVFYAYVAYAFFLLFGGVVALGYCFLRTSRAHRAAVGIAFTACALSVIVVLVNYAMIYFIPGCLFVAFGFLTTDVLLFIGAFRFELFSMVPFALDRVMRTMRGAVIILDDMDRILFLNPAAEELIGRVEDNYSRSVRDALPGLPADLSSTEGLGPHGDSTREVLPGRFFDIQTLPVLNHADHVVGRGISMCEVTAQRAAEEDARRSREKLELMNNITRHDVLNQLTIVEGSLILAGMKAGPGAVQDHIAAAQRASRTIQKQMGFAKDYQEMGVRRPQWHDVGATFRRLAASIGLKDIVLDVEAEGVEVYADPMLEKVFYNLLDNSLEHGGQVSRVRVSVSRANDRLDLVYEDNGAGIPADIKPRLFERGGVSSDSLGMFLCHEILAHSGLTIREDGVPGQGARFVIGVPTGKYRFAGTDGTAVEGNAGRGGASTGVS